MVERANSTKSSDGGRLGVQLGTDQHSNFLASEFSFADLVWGEVRSVVAQEWKKKMYTSPTSYADWFNALRDKEFVEFMTATLQDKTLIDLGGGTGRMSSFAFLFKARAYVNVDAHLVRDNSCECLGFDQVTRFLPSDWTMASQNRQHISFDSDHRYTEVQLKMDMLEFLSRVPDSMVSVITINGIDDCIIHTNDYAEQLNLHIRRVLKEDGVLFGNNSLIYTKKSTRESECLQRVNISRGTCEGFILKKASHPSRNSESF
jgi:hypothetical protein